MATLNQQIPNAKVEILSNGATLITEVVPSVRSAALGIMVGTGSVNENQEKEGGISHYIEHMAFKGTEKRNALEIAEIMDGIGGKMNASTGKETTMFYAVVLDEHLPTAIDLLTDMFLHATYDPKEMAVESKVILEEIKMYEDSPDELIHDLFTQNIMPNHPLGAPILGTEETVSSITQAQILDYCKRYYRPNNVIISVAGNIDPLQVKGLIEAAFQNFHGTAVTNHHPTPSLQKSIKVYHKPVEQVHLCLGTRGISYLSEDRYAFSMLENILGGGMSSRLFQEIREKRGLVYSVYSFNSAYRPTGLFGVAAGTSPQNIDEVIELSLKEIAKIKQDKVSEAELTRAKDHVKGSTVLGLESSSSHMGWSAKSQFYYGHIFTLDEIFQKIDKITTADLLELARKTIVDDYLTLTVIGNVKEDHLAKKELSFDLH